MEVRLRSPPTTDRGIDQYAMEVRLRGYHTTQTALSDQGGHLAVHMAWGCYFKDRGGQVSRACHTLNTTHALVANEVVSAPREAKLHQDGLHALRHLIVCGGAWQTQPRREPQGFAWGRGREQGVVLGDKGNLLLGNGARQVCPVHFDNGRRADAVDDAPAERVHQRRLARTGRPVGNTG